jgi:hypothetical protein
MSAINLGAASKTFLQPPMNADEIKKASSAKSAKKNGKLKGLNLCALSLLFAPLRFRVVHRR